MHILVHTHAYSQQSVSRGDFVRQWQLHAMPLHSATYPDHLLTGLGVCSPSAKCVWNAYWLRWGCTLDPPMRAARAGAPKRVRGWVPNGSLREKWLATCPGVP